MKSFKYFALLTAVAFAFSCEVSEPLGPHDGLVPYDVINVEEPEWSEFIFTSESEDTKTVYLSGQILWSAGDQIRMGYTVGDEWQGSGAGAILYESDQLSSGGQTASFTVPGQFPSLASGSYKFYTVYPSSAADEDFSSAPLATLSIPTIQTPTSSSFDPAADLMIGQSLQTYSSRPTGAIPLRWERKVAHGEITLKKLTQIALTESIVSVKLTAQADADLTGDFLYDFSDEEFDELETSNSVTVKGDNLSWNNGTLTFWVGIHPVEFKDLKITLETDKATYVTTYRGISKEFQANARNVLGIGMAGAKRTPKVEELHYVKVTASQSDWSGKYVLGYLGTTTSAIPLTSVGIVNNNSVGIPGDAVTVTNNEIEYSSSPSYELTISKSGNLYTILLNNEYLGWSSDNTLVSSNSSPNSNYKWNISYSGGTLTIANASNNDRKLQYNIQSTRFACYLASSNQKNISLFKLSSSGGTTPEQDPLPASAAVTTEEVSGLDATSATLNGSFTGANGAVSEVGFYWWKTDSPSTKVTVANTTTSPFSYALSNLEASTTYYVRAYVVEFNSKTDWEEERLGDIVEFTTTAAPVVQYYEKVTSTPSSGDWSGTYLLVYEETTTSGRVCTAGDDAASNYVTATIASSVITSNDLSAYEVEIATYSTGYSMKALGGTYANKYMEGKGSSNNGTEFASSPSKVTTLSLSSGLVTITNNTNIFAYNSTANNYRWRFFKSTTLTGQNGSDYKKPALYKKSTSGGGGTTDPEVSVTTGSATSITATGATLNGSYIIPSGSNLTVKERGFYWGDSKIRVSSGTYTSSASFTLTQTGLTEGTTYTYKAYVIEGNNQERVGSVVSFRTSGGSSSSIDGLYLACYEVPDVSDIYSGERTSGTNSARDDNWFRYYTTNDNRQIATHTYHLDENNPSDANRVRTYTVLYDGTKYAPVWTAHAMHASMWKDNNVGRNEAWSDDPAISLIQQSGLNNAGTVGYSKGHFVASNYRQTSVKQNKQTFYHSNQAPQWQNSFNSGVWSSMEEAMAANLPTGRDTMYVVIGVLYEESWYSNNSHPRTLPSGSLNVPIPSHFYTCIMKCSFNASGTMTAASGIAYLMTNEAHSGHYYDSGFVRSIDYVEALAGFDFFPRVPANLQNAAEATATPLW